MSNIVKRLRAHGHLDAADHIETAEEENRQLWEIIDVICRLLSNRTMAISRYQIIPGAALDAVVDQLLLPLLKSKRKKIRRTT